MTFMQILGIVRARKSSFLMALMAVVLVIGGYTLLQPKTYTAVTSLVIDAHGADAVVGANLSVQSIPGYMATQADIITSKKVAQYVVDQLRLVDDAGLREKYGHEAADRGAMRDWLAERLQKSVRTEPARESSVLGISVDAESAPRAAMLANAFAQAYIRTNLELRTEPARQNLHWLEQQSLVVRQTLEASQARLSAYQQENGIVAADERENLETAQLADASVQLTRTDAEVAELQARQSLAQSLQSRGQSILTLPEVSASPVVAALKAELAKDEARLDDLAARTGSNNPQYLRAREEVAAARRRLQAEASTIVGGTTAGLQVAQQRRVRLQQSLEAKKSVALKAKQQRGELLVLSREVDNARQNYDLAMQKLSQVRLQSQANQTNVMVLNQATEPTRPSKPNLMLRAMAALLLGTMTALAAVFVAEALDRRIRCAVDLLHPAIPLLAVFDARPATRPTRPPGMPGRRDPGAADAAPQRPA